MLRQKHTGRREGLLYMLNKDKEIGTWDSSIKVPVQIGRTWRGNMGDERRTIYFTWIDGVRFWGIQYNVQGQDVVRVKELAA